MSEHVATVSAIYEAFGRGDVGSIMERLAEDVSWDEGIRQTGLGYMQPGRGKPHVQRFFQELASTVAFDEFAPEAMCSGGDTVMVAVRERGRNVISGGEIAEDLMVHLWHFGPDGKVTSFRHIGDWALHERAAAAQQPAALQTARG